MTTILGILDCVQRVLFRREFFPKLCPFDSYLSALQHRDVHRALANHLALSGSDIPMVGARAARHLALDLVKA